MVLSSLKLLYLGRSAKEVLSLLFFFFNIWQDLQVFLSHFFDIISKIFNIAF